MILVIMTHDNNHFQIHANDGNIFNTLCIPHWMQILCYSMIKLFKRIVFLFSHTNGFF